MALLGISKKEAKVLIEKELKDRIKGSLGGITIVDSSKNSTSHFINIINNITLRNHDTELWINDTKRLSLGYQCTKIRADFYFKIVMEIFYAQEG